MAVKEEAIMMLAELNRGSTAAFERFYEEHAKWVYRIALNMLGDRMEAEDLCHDVFVEVMKKPYQFDPSRGSIESWLAVKTRSRCLDRLRKQRRVVLDDGQRLAASDAGLLSTEETVLRRMERRHLREALERIPSPQREALTGMYFDSYTQQELSRRLDRPLGTIKSLIRYGICNVRKQFNQMGWLRTYEGVRKK